MGWQELFQEKMKGAENTAGWKAAFERKMRESGRESEIIRSGGSTAADVAPNMYQADETLLTIPERNAGAKREYSRSQAEAAQDEKQNVFSRLGKAVGAGALGTAAGFTEIAAQATPTSGEQSLGQFSGFGDLGRAVRESRETGEDIDAITKRIEQQRIQQRKAERAKTYEAADMLTQRSAELQERAKAGAGSVGGFLLDLATTGTQMVGDAAMNVLMPGSGLAAMGARVYGQSAGEARRDGKSEGQQVVAGLKGAAIEILTEKLFGGLARAYGAGTADELVAKIADKLTKTEAGKRAATWLINSGGEGIEEALSDIANPVADRLLGLDDGEGAIFTTDDAAQMGYDFLLGSAMGAIGGAGQLWQGAKAGRDVKQNTAPEMNEKAAEAVDALRQGKSITGNQAAAIAKDPVAVAALEQSAGVQLDTEKPISELKRDIVALSGRTGAQESFEAPAYTPRTQTRTQRTAGGFMEAGQQAYNALRQENGSAEAYAGFSGMYNAGLNGVDAENAGSRFTEYLTPEQRYAAYNAGLQDAATVTARENAEVKRVTVDAGSGLVNNEYSRSLIRNNKPMAKTLNEMGKKLGVRIEFVESVAGGKANGQYVREDNTIQIAWDADNPIMAVAAHEITHRMQDLAPEEYRAYRTAAIKHMSKEYGTDSVTEVVERYRQRGEDAGVKLTKDQAMDEMAADFTRGMIEDADLFAEFAKGNRTAAQKLLDSIKEFIAKVRDLVTGRARDAAAQDAFGTDFGTLEKAAEAWQRAFDAAEKTAESAKKTATEGGEARYMIRNVGGETMTVIGTENDTRDFEAAETYLKTLVDAEHPFSTILADAQPVYVGKDLPGEYRSSEYSKNLRKSIREVKMQAATNLDELLLLAENGEWRKNVKPKHAEDAKNGWYRYDAKFAVPILNAKKAIDHYTIYGGTLLIRNDADGKSYLYDLVDIEKKKVISAASFSAKTHSEVFAPKPSSDSIPAEGENVNRKFSLKTYSAEEMKQHAKDAKEFFGKTYNWNETGYITTDGTKLDFSGKHEGGPGGYRAVDHRDIRDALGDDYGGEEYGGSLVQFMSEGNIRISPESGGINLLVLPTKAQFDALSDFVSKNRGEVVVDIDDINGNTLVSTEYPKHTHSSKVVNDIKAYFETGATPHVSELGQFRYQLRGTADVEQELREAGGKYSYAALTSKPDMHLTTVDDTVNYRPGSDARKEVVARGMGAAKRAGRSNENGNAVIHVTDTDTDVVLSRKSLRHGLGRRFSVNAPVTLKAGEILKNAVRVNELTPAKDTINASYVLIGAAKNKNNEPYIVQFVVNRASNEVTSVDVLYAINAKKEPAASLPEVTGVPATLTGSTVSIADLLGYVNQYFPDILPESVLRYYGYTARPDGKLGEGALYQLKGESRLSEELENARAELIEKYGAIPAGERRTREINFPKKTGEKQNVSQTVRTVLEASATPDEMVPTIEELALTGSYSYEAYSDKQAIADAEAAIRDKGWKRKLEEWTDSVKSGVVSKETTALGWALYNNAANSGDTQTALDILSDMVEHQRSAAQALQATRILKSLSPETQLYQVQRSVENLQEEINKRYKDKRKGAPELEIDKDLAEKFMQADTQEKRDAVMRDIYRDIGRQMPSRFVDKWNAWRYLAMLGNARTHVRNIVGNAGFTPVIAAKNAVATVTEEAVSRLSGGNLQRTKAFLGKQGKALLSAASKDYSKVQDAALGGGKYSDYANANKYIEEGRVIFQSNIPGLKQINKGLETARKANSKALDAEDAWFSKPHYAYALAQYCKANGITAEMIARGEGIEKARTYAIKEAQKATYRDTNAFSQAISELGRGMRSGKNLPQKVISTVMEGILPFRKTPANILVRGVEYSPIGLANGIKQALVDVRTGKKTGAEAIDSISSGLTGTGLLALGLYLAAQGVIRGHGGDDDKEKTYEEMLGHQAYSLELPDGTSITLDWLAPECLPLFIGVNLWEQTNGGEKPATLSDILDAVSLVSEPLLEMSCLQSLNDVFDAVGYAKNNGLSGLPSALANAATSYLTQALPTLLGQAERTGEDKRYTTYTNKNDFLTTDMQYTLGRASARIPGWDYNQIPYIDAWGRTEGTGSAGQRAFNNFLNPAYVSKVEETATDKELLRLYNSTDDGGVLPSRAAKTFTVNGQEKVLTADEYAKYAKEKGNQSRKRIDALVKNSEYQKLSDADKARCVKDIYGMSNQLAKQGVSKYQPETWVAEAAANEKAGVSAAVTVIARAKTAGIVSLKDSNGKSISYSKSLLQMQQIYNMKGLSDTQREALFDMLNISDKVKHYNKAKVEQELSKMKNK